jgi:hypothetical protein
VLKKLLNINSEVSEAIDSATFHASKYNTWTVHRIPSMKRRALRLVGTNRITILHNSTPIWNIVVDLNPTKYWNKALVKHVEALQSKTSQCVVFTASTKFYRLEDTLQRWKKLGIQVRLLEHAPSEAFNPINEIAKVLRELLTLETIDPHHTLRSTGLEGWLPSKDSGHPSVK